MIPTTFFDINQYLHMHWVFAGGIVILSTFVSEDLTSIGVGLAAKLELISLSLAMVAALIGVIVGDVLLYSLGRSLRGGLFLSLRKFFLPSHVWRTKQADTRPSPSFGLKMSHKKKRVDILSFS